MKTIEIVSHCYAAKYPHYASALCYQLSSLELHHPRKCAVSFAVCIGHGDLLTNGVLDWWFGSRRRTRLRLFSFVPEILGRRAIGRNVAAKSTRADVVWFADVDQVWRDGCLDRLAAMEWPDGAAMVYPRTIKIHRDHATGDRATNSVRNDWRLVDVDPSEFVDKRYRKAIGGVQIVKGDFARQHGYLDGDPDWQKPAAEPFGDFRDDVAYRRFCLRYGKIAGVDLPGMHRIRHTTTSYQ